MLITSRTLASIVALSSLLVIASGCRVPHVAVRETLPMVDTLHVAGRTVRHYRMRDYTTLDSSDRILRYEYLPVDLFAVVDERDSVTTLFCSGWQTYILRFSKRLDPTDKQYYIPSPMSIGPARDSLQILWGYPQIDERDADLKYADQRRNEYWSIDRMAVGQESMEVWAGPVKSFPQNRTYIPMARFAPDGSYARAMNDAPFVAGRARDEVVRFLTTDGRDSTNR